MSKTPTFADHPIAVIFSGGDAPGMNAFLRAVTRISLSRHHVPVLGVRNGYDGLVEASKMDLDLLRSQVEERVGRWGMISDGQPLVLMDQPAVSGIVGKGGTILGTARCLEFHRPEVRARVVTMLEKLGVRGLIVCGGDGSLTGADLLTKESNLRIIGVPATIDNDLEFTEMALGVDSAVNTLVWAVDCFKDTARAHRRVMILETMGRGSGELARLAAIASGAEMVVTPDAKKPMTRADMDALALSIESGMKAGRSHAIVLIAEGVKMEPEIKRNRAYVLADAFKEFFERAGGPFHDLEIRPSVLGHLQRGGHTSPQDCILAARFAEAALNEIMRPGGGNGVTALRRGRIEIVPFGAPPLEDAEARSNASMHLHESLSSWEPL
ncbi:MAG: 6-phosphofructokinase [Verrucomicrobiaceae bacterium]|nr:6-phosphofructokinase [Verrucomicrobiaceae bacterium]